MPFVANPTVNFSNPSEVDSQYEIAPASGLMEVNPGDWLSYSGLYVVPTHDGVAWFKASAAGMAVDRNPTYDFRGIAINNSALIHAKRGKFRVSASFSGQPNLGVLVFPDMTGSGVNAPSGNTGLGAVWGTALPILVSGATAAAPSKAVGQMVAWYGGTLANAGTGQMDIRIWERDADYY